MIGWTQHGGSGLSYSHEDMLGMTLPELQAYAQKAMKQRQREAAAIRRAQEEARSRRT